MNTPNGNPPDAGQSGQPQGGTAQGDVGGPQLPYGMGPAPNGQHFYGPPPGTVPPEMPPPWPGYAGMQAPYPPQYAFYGVPPGVQAAAGPAPGMQMPPGTPPPAPNGFEAMFNDMADKNGLGMLKGFFNLEDGDFWKGALVGAAVVMLLTNEDLRNALISGAAKTAEAVKSGLGAADDDDVSEMPNGPAASDDNHEESEA